nr:hypothetical protein [uncultured Rhodopila sp.]
MNLLSTDLAAIVAAILVAVSAWAVRAQSHARHEARVRLLRETTESLHRKAEEAARFRAVAGMPVQGSAASAKPSQVFPA